MDRITSCVPKRERVGLLGRHPASYADAAGQHRFRASKLPVSARTLDRIFAKRNETVMRRVYDERTSQAANLSALMR